MAETTATERPRRLRTALVDAALVLASLLLGCGLIEAGLRLADFPRREARFQCYDPIMGNVFCPNMIGEYRALGARRPLRTNADGLADDTHARAKPKGAFRIALLGDSIVAGLDVDAPQRIAPHWEAALNAASDRRVEVVNFAVPGTGTWEQIQMYHLRVRDYHPDMVLLAFFWGNDVWNNSARLAKGSNNPLEDDYQVRSANEIRVLHRAFSRWVWNHSVLYQAASDASDKFTELRRQAAIHGWREALKKLRSPPAARSPHLNVETGMPEYDWSSPDWDLTRRLILKLAEETRQDGIPLVVFHIPAIVHDRARLPRAQFERFLAQHGIPALSLFDLYDGQTQEEYLRQFIPGDVHWTAEGHAQAAAHTSAALSRIIASQAPR
jgi:hypothetical protein